MIKRLLGNFLVPIVYLFIWLFFIKYSAELLSLKIFDNNLFLGLSFLVLLFGLISKSTSWSIGHEKFGIKADSTSKKVEFCADKIGTIKIFDDDLEARERLIEKAGEVIKKLRKK